MKWVYTVHCTLYTTQSLICRFIKSNKRLIISQFLVRKKFEIEISKFTCVMHCAHFSICCDLPFEQIYLAGEPEQVQGLDCIQTQELSRSGSPSPARAGFGSAPGMFVG